MNLAPLAEFRFWELDLNADETTLFFGEPVLFGVRRTSLWGVLTVLEREAEGQSWKLVEMLACGQPLAKYRSSMLEWRLGWTWNWGNLRADRVRWGLSLWGVLRRSRMEETGCALA